MLISPDFDLSNQRGARLEVDTAGILGVDDYFTYGTQASNEATLTYGDILVYPGWAYGVSNRDISRLDGQIGNVKLYLRADLFEYGYNSSGIFTVKNVRISVLDQSQAAVNSVWYADGTSFSAPIVAGVAAMLFSQVPTLTAKQAKNIILSSARAVPSLSGKLAVAGVIDANAALIAAKALPKPIPTITFTQPATPVTYAAGKTFSLTATSSSGGTITYTSSSPYVISVTGKIATIRGVGTATLSAKVAATGNYTTASATRSVTVNKITPTVTFTQPTTPVVYASGKTFSLTATSSSGGAITYTSSAPSVISVIGRVATIKGKGSAIITAKVAATANYNAASATRSVTVK